MTKKKKRTLFIILGAALAVLLAVGIFLLWYFRLWFFKPRLDTAAFSGVNVLTLDEPVSPSEKQRQAVADFVKQLSEQSYHMMDLTERKGAKKLLTFTEYLAGDDPDILQMLSDMDIKVTDTKTGKEVKAGGTQKIVLKADGTLSLVDTAASRNEPVTTMGEAVEGVPASELSLTLPSEAFHGSAVRLSSINAESVVCPSCKHTNPGDAEFCEKCGTKLKNDNDVEIEGFSPTGLVNGMTEAQRESMMLNNLSSTLLLANRSAMSYYLTCLSCMKDPDNVSALVSLVTHLRMRDGLEEALLICEHGLELDPTREELYVHAGNICIQLDQPDKALSYLNRCITVDGYSGPAYQAMMFSHLQKKDYVNAFDCMIKGARDGYTSSIRVVYDMIKLRPDYWDFAGEVFKKYTVSSLMDFSVNRSGFNPANELAGKTVDIGACAVPYNPEDWLASAEPILKNAKAYLTGAISFYKEDIEELGKIYNILINSDSVTDLAKGFLSAFGDKLKKEKLTEAERVISYEQEIFWMDILDDYREWKVKDIRAKMDEVLDNSDMEDVMGLISKYLANTQKQLESINFESMEGLTYALQFFLERVVGNESIAFTSSESTLIVSKIKAALRTNGTVRNKAYGEIADVLRDYYMYSNALLGMIADKEQYQYYRREITLNVTADQGLCVAENAFFAYCVPILAEPYLMIGVQTHEGIGSGAQTGNVPNYPKFILSNKAVRPSADMSADIEIPDIRKITDDVLGVDLHSQAGYEGTSNFPALEQIWSQYWRDNNPDYIGPAPLPPNFNDSMERIKFWNSLTPEQRVKYSAMVADPNVVNKAIVLDLYCARGQSAVHFSEQKVGLLSGTSASISNQNLGIEVGADGTVSGTANVGIGSLSIDNRGNFTVTMKDKVSGAKFGVNKTGRDITAYTGTDLGFRLLGPPDKPEGDNSPSAGVGGFGGKISGTIYTTYSLAMGKITSGGVKSGASFVLGGLLGFGTTTNVNLVQGISTMDIYLIIAGDKLNLRIKEDYNYEDERENNDVPGLQEFHR